MDKEGKKLQELVARIIDTRREQDRINPSWIATEALNELDPERSSVPLVYIGCHLHLRQIARGLCRDIFEAGDDEESARDSLFPELQWRYPEPHKRGEEPSYVVRELMTDDIVRFNVVRLRKEAQAKSDHADALEAWHIARRAAWTRSMRGETTAEEVV